MKYILIEHPDGPEPKQMTIFDTPGERANFTRKAIMGDAKGPCPDLLTLAVDGIVTYEGDPPLEWIDADVHQNLPCPIEHPRVGGCTHEEIIADPHVRH